jgi:transposase
MIITDGNVGDCTQAEALIEGLPSDCLIADKAYDTNALLELLTSRKMEAVIPPKRNRKDQRAFDEYLYKLRHIIENTFLKFKAWRSIATRYAKTTASFQAECQLAAIMLWLR